MWRHTLSKGKGKSKQDEGPSSSSQAQSDTLASLFAVIVSFPFIFIYTCSFEFIVMFYLIYVMHLFAGHNRLSIATRATSWGASWPRAALNSDAADDRRGGGSHGVGRPRGARGP
jgi:hypothetical protein